MDFIRKHKLIAATILIQIIALPLIILLVRQQQQTQTQAQASTALYFTPNSSVGQTIQTTVGQNLSLDLMVDPGENLISFAKIEINYDKNLFEPASSNPVVVNSTAFPVIVEGPLISPGKIQIAVSVGSDWNKVIQAETKVLTLNMKSIAPSNNTTEVSISSNTQLLSAAGGETYYDNVLQTKTPALININASATPTAVASPTPVPAACVPAFSESGGSVVFEAENFDFRTSNGDSHKWTLVNGGPYPEQPDDILFMGANPIDGTVIGSSNYQNSPELSYKVNFTTTGTYWVYVRSSGNNANSASAHIGLDDQYVSTMNLYYIGQEGKTSNWSWVNNNNNGTLAKVNVTSPGVHTFHFWMRESGTKIDRVRLVQNDSWIPNPNHSAFGPIESTKITCPNITPTPTSPPEATETPVPTATLTPTPTPAPDVYTLEIKYKNFSFSSNPNSGYVNVGEYKKNGVVIADQNNIVYTWSDNAPAVSITPFNDNCTLDGLTKPCPNNRISLDATDYANGSGTLSLTVRDNNRSGTELTASTSFTFSGNSPSPTAANTVINFNGLKLHGLGAGGDNPNPTSWGTLNPLRPTRNLTVQIFNTSGTLVHTGNITITYTGPNTGLFNGSLTLPNSIASGTYTIKLTTPYYLTKLVPGFQNLIQGTTHSITSVALVAGDVNRDNQLRVSDYDIIMDCYSDLLPARNCDTIKKVDADISDDGKVNQDDYNLFLREFSVQSGD